MVVITFSMQTFSEVCNISFNEDNIKDFINTIYEKRYISFVGICPKTAPSQGYTMCKYINWVGMHGKIGDKNNYHKHLHMYLSKAQFYNLSRFRLGAWKLNVNDINLKHINRSMRFCSVFVVTALTEIITLWKMKSM